jgi:hypothetical protein
VSAPLPQLSLLTPGKYTLVSRAVIEMIAPSVVDPTRARWTIAEDGVTILRDLQDAGGRGSGILTWDEPSPGSVYVFGTNSSWWKWQGGTGWTEVYGRPRGGTTVALATGTFARSVNSEPSNVWVRTPIVVY